MALGMEEDESVCSACKSVTSWARQVACVGRVHACVVVMCVSWSTHGASSLTSELSEGRVRLEVEALPVLVERLHAERSGLLNGHHRHSGHRRVNVKATANL